jgi:hypothetical protein
LNKRRINPLDEAFLLDSGTDDLPAGEIITEHHSTILAALGIREADLVLFKALAKASDGTLYINDDLTLSNLSFLWRHAWLSKLLKTKAEDWRILLKIFQQDIPAFANPKAAFEFVENIDYLKNAGFTFDELNWLLAADRTAKAAVKEADTARFLTALRKELQLIQTEYDPAQYDSLTAVPPTDVDNLTALLTTILQKLKRDETATQFFISTLRDDVSLETTIGGLPSGFDFPAAIKDLIRIIFEPALYFNTAMTAAQRATLLTDPSLAAVTGLVTYQEAIAQLFLQPGRVIISNLPTGFTFPASITGLPNNIPIRYESVLRFTGVMTVVEKTTLLTAASLAAVTGIAAYQDAIDELFTKPRLALKFYDPVFTAPLEVLPTAIDFKILSDALALKISYDAENRLLRFSGILSRDEKTALETLSADIDYRNALNSIAVQPQTAATPDERIWLLDADLQFPLRDLIVPAADNLPENLALAATKALDYLSVTLSEAAVIEQCSTQLDLPEPLARRLLSDYPRLPGTLLDYLTNVFAATSGVVDYLTLKTAFDGWFWANRVAAIWKKWKITLPELDQIIALTAGAQLLDFLTLPLDETGTMVARDRFLRINRLLRLRDALPETSIKLLEVLEKLNAGTYATAADFAAVA